MDFLGCRPRSSHGECFHEVMDEPPCLLRLVVVAGVVHRSEDRIGVGVLVVPRCMLCVVLLAVANISHFESSSGIYYRLRLYQLKFRRPSAHLVSFSCLLQLCKTCTSGAAGARLVVASRASRGGRLVLD